MDENALARQLADPASAGVYCVTARDLSALVSAAGEAGMPVFRIDLSRIRRRDDLLAAIGEAMDFPEWYGRNLDALADCLADLGWRPAGAYVVVLEGGDAMIGSSPGDLAAVLAVFADTADMWREDGVPFWCLVEASAGTLAGLRDLP